MGQLKIWDGSQWVPATNDHTHDYGALTHYHSGDTTSFGNGATLVVTGWALDGGTSAHYATHSAGTLTFTRGGTYLVNASLTWASNVNGRRLTIIYKNGSEVRRTDTAAAGNATVPIGHMLAMVMGDTLDVRGVQTSGGSLGLIAVPGHDLQITRIGD